MLNDGTVVENSYTIGPLVMPRCLCTSDTLSVGDLLSCFPPLLKDGGMYLAFRRFGPMDFQRSPGSNSFDQTYRDFGNFNFGAVAAAAGYAAGYTDERWVAE